MARTLWRRHLALSLALRLFARIVLLDLAVFVTWGSDLRSSLVDMVFGSEPPTVADEMRETTVSQ